MSTGAHQGSQIPPALPAFPSVGGNRLMNPSPTSIIPAKRPEEDDDDIQFISSKPVKRRKLSEAKLARPMPPPPQQLLPLMPAIPSIPVLTPAHELRDSDRRISTGMVGLPVDIHTLELANALRGVSLPALESFVLDQPLRRPRPASPPELSPKQQPQTISPEVLNIYADHTMSHPDHCRARSDESPSSTPASRTAGDPKATSSYTENASSPKYKPLTSATNIASAEVGQNSNPPIAKESTMPPPPLPTSEVPSTPDSTKHDHATTGYNPHDASKHDMQKPPCQICMKARQQQAQYARAQGFPLLNPNIPHHLMPQMPCHQPYPQHFQHQMYPVGSHNMSPFVPGFPPFILPFNNNGNVSHMRTQMTPPTLQTGSDQGAGSTSQGNTTNAAEENQTSVVSPPSTNNTTARQTGSSSPAKPHSSHHAQQTHRKPSPNLIVDISETCQETFPFEEVAKRHNVAVDKVLDVFAAIIQVPLLRCPTDRRRAGRLATARVKEYNRTKKDIVDDEGGNRPGTANKQQQQQQPVTVTASDVAERLGTVGFPEGFNY